MFLAVISARKIFFKFFMPTRRRRNEALPNRIVRKSVFPTRHNSSNQEHDLAKKEKRSLRSSLRSFIRSFGICWVVRATAASTDQWVNDQQRSRLLSWL
mmetsp:Transcript_13376/g.36893  ORF Transcript_13376/g.36893 Transcript_13376/m.36893 type:complete len:99 (-) Transcript_13376:136-432(-)